jgi:hypothetical protein
MLSWWISARCESRRNSQADLRLPSRSPDVAHIVGRNKSGEDWPGDVRMYMIHFFDSFHKVESCFPLFVCSFGVLYMMKLASLEQAFGSNSGWPQ